MPQVIKRGRKFVTVDSYRLTDADFEQFVEPTLSSPLEEMVYRPPQNRLVPKDGAWGMLSRTLPPMERGVDQKLLPGSVFWLSHDGSADDYGYVKGGRYLVRADTPEGDDIKLWPYEYVVLAPEFIIALWQEGDLAFHPNASSDKEFSERLFFAMSRGIHRADALVMALGSFTGPIGWFSPSDTLMEFTDAMSRVGAPLSEVNHRRRRAARKARKESHA